ncbi:MAG: hypothetical protein E6J42_08740 [Chloroflexi bacterium]|nr:MAG: hypothetical protein E6J42_08740 [Chloroflexota bacterium]
MPTPTPSPTPAPFYPGDVDCDTHINSVDALKVLRHVVGLPVTGNCASFNGDIDCNGMQNSVDALKLLRYVAGLSVSLPPSCPPIGP